MHRSNNRVGGKAGFSLVELLVVLGIIAMLVVLFLPATRGAGEAARRNNCSNQLRQLTLGILNYESAHGELPHSFYPSHDSVATGVESARRLSETVSLLPYIEEMKLYEMITQPLEANGVVYSAFGPLPSNADYPPWRATVEVLRCASAPGPDGDAVFGSANYAFCIGDRVTEIHNATGLRGAFGNHRPIQLKDVRDGTSKTIGMAEIGSRWERSAVGDVAVQQPAAMLRERSLCSDILEGVKYKKDIPLSQDGRGGRWADGAAGSSLINTVLPPQSPSAAVGGDGSDGFYSAGSYHEGGVVMTAFLDGHVKPISGGIAHGDLTQPPPAIPSNTGGPIESPYGIWGALGTIAGHESTEGSY